MQTAGQLCTSRIIRFTHKHNIRGYAVDTDATACSQVAIANHLTDQFAITHLAMHLVMYVATYVCICICNHCSSSNIITKVKKGVKYGQ